MTITHHIRIVLYRFPYRYLIPFNILSLIKKDKIIKSAIPKIMNPMRAVIIYYKPWKENAHFINLSFIFQ